MCTKQIARKSIVGYAHYLRVKKDPPSPVKLVLDDAPFEVKLVPEGSVVIPSEKNIPIKEKEPELEYSPIRPIVISSEESEEYNPLSDDESEGYTPLSETESEGYTPLSPNESEESTPLTPPDE